MDVSQAPVQSELPLRPQDEVECRRCAVRCAKLGRPAGCIERSCPFLYAYREHGHTFMGCMQRVFDVELDLDLVREAERRGPGFGAVKARKRPLPVCTVEVETCYEHRIDELGCVNPEFFEVPRERPSFRVFAQVTR